MAISHALQPLLLLLLSLFFLPAALGAFVNFTNCAVTKSERLVNVTSVRINPYPLGLGDAGATFTITADTTFNVTARNIVLDTHSVPLMLNREFLYILTPQSEYWAAIRMHETGLNQIMCVSFKYLILSWTF
ncbi:hypothetical protein DY000_02038746 [Brassica cretica]|uniref:Late embryogenesis abundant protein LEA-2 subgroup domain-containing protein n=1 Tax=Brassica cretica TaxID=69181 RepID=A0ABQ7BAT9_BRACR|nr:hypothetical protein DY000_02038746 [Brassica cretica]